MNTLKLRPAFKLHQKIIVLLILIFIVNEKIFSQAPNIRYPTPKAYVINNAITLLSPTNTGGTVPATIYGQVSTYAGSNKVSIFGLAIGVAVDAAGNIYVCSWLDDRIIQVSPSLARTTFAGTSSGTADGQGTAAQFYEPDAIIIDAAGNFIIADQGNNMIRKMTSGGLVTTLAGNTTPGLVDGTGTAARFSSPRGLAIDVAGNVYVADQGNNVVRKITPAGAVSTYAGTGSIGLSNGSASTATFNSPCGVAFDSSGNLYIGDSGNNCVRKVTPAGIVSTFATGFNFPREIRVDGTGNLYVCDQHNHFIRRISPTGVVTIIAGTGQSGSNDGAGNIATFTDPIGLVLDGKGNMFVGDGGLVRKISVSGYTIDKTLPTGLVFDQTTGIISGTPTVVSAPTNYTVTAYNGTGSNSTVVNIEVALTPKPSIINFPILTNPFIDANNNVTPGATSTNNETIITYTSSNTAVATITANGLIHLVGPGISIITASQSGNVNYLPATPVTEILTVVSSQQITFPSISSKLVCDADFSAAATISNNTIPITYASSNINVATISAQGIIHIVGIGSTTISIDQNGDNLYTPAPTQSQILTVTAPIVPVISITSNATSVCTGVPVTFIASVSNLNSNLVYQWKVNGVNAGTGSPNFSYIPLLSTDVVQCVVTNTVSCQAMGTSNIVSGFIVNPYLTPIATITSSVTAPVCSGSAITFTATSSGAGATQATFTWQVNGVTSDTNNPIFTDANLSDGDLVTCLVNYAGYACFTSASSLSNAIKASIITPANPAPSLTITSSVNSVYIGTKITYNAVTANTGSVITYQWKRNGSNVGSNSATYSTDLLSNGDIITCTINTDIMCTVPTTSNSIVVKLLAPPAIKIPNTFTPNGDGFNDTWVISNLAYYPNCSISIYSRYGQLLYQSQKYITPWDGTFRGKQLPLSAYYYMIDLGQGTKLSGSVTLIR